jgi:hypothetical protein
MPPPLIVSPLSVLLVLLLVVLVGMTRAAVRRSDCSEITETTIRPHG